MARSYKAVVGGDIQKTFGWSIPGSPYALDSSDEGVEATYDLTQYATLPAGIFPVWRVVASPAGVTIDQSGLLTKAASVPPYALYTVLISLSQDFEGYAETYRTFTFPVIPENSQPVWAANTPTGSPTPLVLTSGVPYNFGQYASDPDGDTLTFSLVNAPANYSINPTTGAVTATTSVWATPTPSYLPIVPLAAGHGMNTTAGSGRSASVPNSLSNAAPVGGGTTILFVDSLAPTYRGGSSFGSSDNTISGGVGYGTLAWCLASSGRNGAPVSGARTVIPLKSGVVAFDPTTAGNARSPYATNSQLYVAANTTFAGEAAPAPGLTLYGRGLLLNGNNICIRHLTVVWPGQPGYGASAFGAYGLQGQSVYQYDNHVYANCTALWGTGIGFGINNSIGTLHGALWQCAVLQPVYLPSGTYTLPSGASANVEAIGRGNSYDNFEDLISETRCLFAHCVFRTPLTRALRGYFADNVSYDIGLAGGYFGSGSYGTAINSKSNFRSVIYMDGPNTGYFPWNANPTSYLQGALSFPSSEGGSIYMDRVASVGGAAPLLYGSYIRTSITAYPNIDPEGYSPRAYVGAGNYDRTLTLAQVQEQVELVCSTAGARPRNRLPEVTTIVNQVIAKARGETTGLGSILGGTTYGTNSVPGVLWPAKTLATVTENTISNPTVASAYWGGTACPIGDKDTIASSGYTVLEEWLHQRHAEVI